FIDEEPERETDEEIVNEEDMKKFEEELENLANNLNQFSVEIDELNEKITERKAELSDVESTLAERKEVLNEDNYKTKKKLENDIINRQKEIQLISALEEIDSTEEVRSLNADLTAVMEDLRNIENEAPSDEEIKTLEERAETLHSEIKE